MITDNCDGPVEWRFAGCVSDQPDDAPDPALPGWNGDGETSDDCVVAANGEGICVRSERAGAGPGDHGLPGPSAQDGRHYSVMVQASDACGNESPSVEIGRILVPHDRNPQTETCRRSSPAARRSKSGPSRRSRR